jgi:thiamine-phosphate pyrophosphorylase
VTVELGRLILVTDRRAAAEKGHELIDVVTAALSALPPAAALVQLRDKDLPPRDLHALARRLLDVTRARRCPLLVNDRVDVALAAGVDGVHLPALGLPIAAARRLSRPGTFLIGVSVHSADAAGAAARDGADLVLCGPVWDTPSKRGMGDPLGEGQLAAAARAIAGAGSAARLYAIGGITSGQRAAAASAAGAHGAAVVRAIMLADDPGRAALELYEAMPPRTP